jgi:hypothetical protein
MDRSKHMATFNGNWLRKKSTDSIVKGLFRSARKSDYTAALALLDRLSEIGHDDFADMLRHTVTIQPGGADGWKARFVSWRVEEYMCGERVVTNCSRCGKKTCGQPSSLPSDWMLDNSGPEEKAFCPNCHNGFGKAFSH